MPIVFLIIPKLKYLFWTVLNRRLNLFSHPPHLDSFFEKNMTSEIPIESYTQLNDYRNGYVSKLFETLKVSISRVSGLRVEDKDDYKRFHVFIDFAENTRGTAYVTGGSKLLSESEDVSYKGATLVATKERIRRILCKIHEYETHLYGVSLISGKVLKVFVTNTPSSLIITTITAKGDRMNKPTLDEEEMVLQLQVSKTSSKDSVNGVSIQGENEDIIFLP